MAEQDYYALLGVGKDASEADLKKAYRRLAMKYHPDRNPGDADAEQRFKAAKQAYEVLSDPQKRAAYDRFGQAGVDGMGGGGGGGRGPSDFSDIFSDVFGDFFGGGGGARGQRVYRGADLRYDLELSLEEAAHGCEKRIRVPGWVVCDSCDGTGSQGGKPPETCPTCNGHGDVRVQQGFFSIQQTCPRCGGSGKIISDPCRSCGGSGRQRKDKDLSVKIPAGVDSGDRIRLSGEGELGERGGPPGDLYVQVVLREHAIFTRKGEHLHCQVPISMATATLGGELEVPTLDGRVSLRIPEGTQSGKVFRLRGKGIKPVRGGMQGDLLCRVAVETPVNLTREQKELLERFCESVEKGGKRHSPESQSWLDKARKFFEGML